MLAYRGMVAQANLHTFDDSESRTSDTVLQTRTSLPGKALRQGLLVWLQTSSGVARRPCGRGKRVILAPDEFGRL